MTFYRPVDFEKRIENWTEELTESRITILKEMHINSNVTTKELQGFLGISATAIDNNIELSNNGFLERVGGDKGGKWLIHY